MIALSDLIRARTKDEMLATLLQRLQGVSGVEHVGTSSGVLTLSGRPTYPNLTTTNVEISVYAVYNPPDVPSLDFRVYIGGEEMGDTSVGYDTEFDLGYIDGVLSGLSMRVTSGVEAGDRFVFQLTAPAFPTTSWEAGSVPRALLEAEADTLAELSRTFAALVNGTFVETATGSWLTLLARNSYGLDRMKATSTEGAIELVNSSTSPHSVAAGALTVQSNSGLKYTNRFAFTLPASSTLPAVDVVAERPGSLYNTPSAGTIVTMVTALAGVTCSNASDWVTRQGTDDESDALLRQRCRDAWASIGTGSTEAVYRLWARSASEQVTRVSVAPSSVAYGRVDVWIAGPSTTPLSSTVVDTVAAYLNARIPMLTGVLVQAASSSEVLDLTGGYVYTNEDTGVVSTRVDERLREYLGQVEIGGTIYVSDLYRIIATTPGVLHVTLDASLTDVNVPDNTVPEMVNGLAYIQEVA